MLLLLIFVHTCYKSANCSKQIINIHPKNPIIILLPLHEKIEHVILDEQNLQYHIPKNNLVILTCKNLENLQTFFTIVTSNNKIYSWSINSNIKYNNRPQHIKIKNSTPPDIKKDFISKKYYIPSKFNFNFTMSGNTNIAPNRVFSDGHETWLDYGPKINKINLPIILKREANKNMIVDVIKKHQMLIIQETGTFILKNGNKITCIKPNS